MILQSVCCGFCVLIAILITQFVIGSCAPSPISVSDVTKTGPLTPRHENVERTIADNRLFGSSETKDKQQNTALKFQSEVSRNVSYGKQAVGSSYAKHNPVNEHRAERDFGEQQYHHLRQQQQQQQQQRQGQQQQHHLRQQQQQNQQRRRRGQQQQTIVGQSCGDGLCKCDRGRADCSNHARGIPYVPILPNDTFFLKLSNNGIHSIVLDNYFENVTGLQTLALSKNGLRHVNPEAFALFTDLHDLYLDDNPRVNYSMIQNATSKLHLREFTCIRCHLGPIPAGFFQQAGLSSLTQLLLYGNNLGPKVKLSDFQELIKLDSLGLSDNQITHFEVDVVASALTILNIAQNNLVEFPETCRENNETFFPNLTQLLMKENHISAINNHVCLPELQVLELATNRVVKMAPCTFNSQLFPKLTELYLYSMIQPYPSTGMVISANAFNNSALRTLNLRDNGLEFHNDSFVSGDSFRNCPGLRRLILTKNFLSMTEQRFHNLFGHLHLQALYLDDGMITNVSATTFTGFSELQNLTLNRNQLSIIPDGAFDGLPRLTDLDISTNQLSALSPGLFSDDTRRRLRKLDMSRNPFVCSCDILWFRDWLVSSPALFNHSWSKYACNNLQGLEIQEFVLNQQACLLSQDAYKLIVVVMTLVVLSLSTATISYRYRWHVRLAWFEAFRGRDGGAARRRRLQSEEFAYDVYVAYEAGDLPWVKWHLIPQLEERLGLRLCIHERDFMIGWDIVENIAHSVQGSKKMLMVISSKFARNQWCQFELSFCLRHAMDHDDNLLIVILDDVISSHDLTATMMAVLKMTPYIQWEGSDKDAVEACWGRVDIALQEILPRRRQRP